MRIIVLFSMILMLGCTRKNLVLDESKPYTYELEMKSEDDDLVLYLYLENLSNDTFMLKRHTLYCGTMSLNISTLDNHVIGKLGYSADCIPIKILPFSKETTFMSVYELINAGYSTRNYNFTKGTSYKIRLKGRNQITSNEITFIYNPPKIEKPILGKFESRYTSEGYQIYAKMFDEDISLDSLYLVTYNSQDYLSRNQMKSKGIITEKKDSLFSITILDKFVDQILVSNNIERTEMFLVGLYFGNVDKNFITYFFPKKKDE